MGVVNEIHSYAVSAVRLGRGMVAWRRGTPPRELLELYEFEL